MFYRVRFFFKENRGVLINGDVMILENKVKKNLSALLGLEEIKKTILKINIVLSSF